MKAGGRVDVAAAVGRSSRRRYRTPALTAAVLGAGLAAAIVLTTPWNPLGADLPGGPTVPTAGRDFTGAQIARIAAYRSAVHPWGWASLAVGIVTVVLLGFTRAGARLVDRVARPFGRGWAWRVLAGTPAVLAVVRLATLVPDAGAHNVAVDYGLSTQGWAGWLADYGRSYLVAAVPTTLALLALYALARRLPRRWWAPAAAAAAVLVVAGSFGYPLLVEPVFNSFRPLPAGPLRSSLLVLADRAGVRVDDVLVADASRRTTALNAYVSGFAGTRRIVLYDTLLRSAPPEQVRVVVAHELGHAKRRDVLRGTLIGAGAAAFGVTLLFLVLPAGAGRAPRTLALVLAWASIGQYAALPVVNLVSRRVEARADIAALDLTRDPATFVAVQRTLAVRGLTALDPPPWAYYWFATHPTPPERIALARDWARLRGGENR